MKNDRFRMIGTTDDVVECAKCGKVDLKATVVLEFLDEHGESEGVTYYGSTCAARALKVRGVSMTAAQVRDAASAAERQRRVAREHAEGMLAYYGSTVDEETVLKFQAANRSISGPRPLAECERLLREGIARWTAALAS